MGKRNIPCIGIASKCIPWRKELTFADEIQNTGKDSRSSLEAVWHTSYLSIASDQNYYNNVLQRCTIIDPEHL